MEYGQIRPLQVIEIREVNGRGERIRTSGPCLPKAEFFQLTVQKPLKQQALTPRKST